MPSRYRKRVQPYKKGQQYRRGKYYYRKKKFANKRPAYNTVIQKQLITSDRMFCKLKYLETNSARTSITIASGTNQQYLTYFSNQLIDHASGTPSSSVQIPGLIQWASMYARYRVHAIKVKVMMVSDDGLSDTQVSKPLMAYIHLQSDPSPGNFTTWNQIRQLDGNRYTVFKPLAIGQSGIQVQPLIMSKYYNLSKINGNQKQYEVDTSFEGLTGALGVAPIGPSRVFNYYVGIMTMDGTSTATAQRVSVYLTTTFYVEFKDRYDVAAPVP